MFCRWYPTFNMHVAPKIKVYVLIQNKNKNIFWTPLAPWIQISTSWRLVNSTSKALGNNSKAVCKHLQRIKEVKATKMFIFVPLNLRIQTQNFGEFWKSKTINKKIYTIHKIKNHTHKNLQRQQPSHNRCIKDELGNILTNPQDISYTI